MCIVHSSQYDNSVIFGCHSRLKNNFCIFLYNSGVMCMTLDLVTVGLAIGARGNVLATVLSASLNWDEGELRRAEQLFLALWQLETWTYYVSLSFSIFLSFSLCIIPASSSCSSICSSCCYCKADQLLRSLGWNDINIRMRWISSISPSEALPRRVCITQLKIHLPTCLY